MLLAVLICFIDICESISIAKALAQVRRWHKLCMQRKRRRLHRASARLSVGTAWRPARCACLGCDGWAAGFPRCARRPVVEAARTALYRACSPQKNKYALNATQELRGLGVANLFGAAFNCYTTTGSFSRSAVNNEVG